jgi:putative SOS response-associated peptidase YedK
VSGSTRSCPRDHALALLEPPDAALMRAAPASRLVNAVKNEGPELLVPDDEHLTRLVAAA